jgi:cytoskeleton protein RodZ
MSEDQQNSTEETSESGRDGPRCGERLAEARREQEITVLEVSKELHLDEHKVRALERNDFDVLGAPVFAKGHLRKYAQLVGVDEGDVFADYYAMTRADGVPPIVAGRKRIRHEMSPGPWIAAAVVLLVAAAAYWWFVVRIENNIAVPLPQNDPVEVAPDSVQPDVGGSAAMKPQEQPPERQEQPQEPTPEQVAAPAVQSEPVEQAAADPGDQLQVTLSFSGECWTEISDAGGKQLFFSMGRDGQTVELNGKAPITALFGNADNVEVFVNDNPYALPAPNAANRTVRVAILNQ